MEKSLPWGGDTTGDCGPYSDNDWADMNMAIYQRERTMTSVIRGYGNELRPLDLGGGNIRIQSGAAIVDGVYYENTGNVDFTLDPHTAADTYRVVLQKDWTAQTIRLVILGPGVSPAYPAITQTDGTLWEVSLYKIDFNMAGTPAFTGESLFSADNLYAANRNGSGFNYGFGVPGNDPYFPIPVALQVGAGELTAGDAVETVYFPIPFNGIPSVVISLMTDTVQVLYVASITTQLFTVRIVGAGTAAGTIDFSWIAVGPEGYNWDHLVP